MLASLIPTRVHGVIDYLVGAVLIFAPWLLGFSDNHAATLVAVVMGAAAILYSLLTRYELGLIRVIPMPVHLGIDLLSGLLLAASPWLFGFAHRIYMPHLVVGIMEIIIVLISSPVPSAAGLHHSNVASDRGDMGRPNMV